MVGAVETVSQAIVQAAEQILLRPPASAMAVEAASSTDSDRFERLVWEALRFNPITTLVPRFCERDVVLAQNTAHQTVVARGQAVAVCTGSAMFDDTLFDKPEEFRLDRPQSSYLHFGFGHHECLGRYVALVAIPESLKQLFMLPGLKLLDGEAGKIDFGGGPFPERFVVNWGEA
jgi:cytochrome P450